VAGRTPFQVEVLTPEGEIFNDEVEMLSTRTAVGSIGVLANHTPLLALLEPTELRLFKSDSEVVAFAQGEGYLQVQDSHALVLVDEVFEKDELASSDLRAGSTRRPSASSSRGRLRGEAPGRAGEASLRGVPQARRRRLTHGGNRKPKD
jgi:F-type H+-transporting ATPase subunit epsilon